METNEPPHTGNLKGSSPLSTSSFPENSPGGPSNSHFITLSPPHHLLALPLSSPTLSLPLSVVYLLIFPITLPESRWRIGLAFCSTIRFWYIALLGPYQMCQWKLWAVLLAALFYDTTAVLHPLLRLSLLCTEPR